MIDVKRPDVVSFWGKVRKDAGAGGCWFYDDRIIIDGHQGPRRVAWYLSHGDFGVPLNGQVEKNFDCAAGCCRPDHQKFVPYRPIEVRYPRRERDKKIRLLAGRGWKNRHIAGECKCSMGIVRRVLKDGS